MIIVFESQAKRGAKIDLNRRAYFKKRFSNNVLVNGSPHIDGKIKISRPVDCIFLFNSPTNMILKTSYIFYID